ncbi:MAG TPA: efflux RND transporter periplasmic adaptor subunit [Gammaproteobacteria bacterium]
MALNREALDALRMDRAQTESAAVHRARPWIIGGLIAVAVIVAGVAWVAMLPDAVTVKVTTVRNTAAAPSNNGTVLTASGYVVARRIATASSKVTGQIDAVLIEEGQRVEAGEVLARLDDSIAQKELALAESRLERARRAVEETRVRLAEAERNLERTRSLREDKLVSAAALDTATAEFNAWTARLAVAKSDVEVAERNTALAKQGVENTLIRAPFSGVVVAKNAQPGEMISPISAGGGFTRTGIGTIVDMQSLEIEVDVNEAYIDRVRSGQPVEATLNAYSGWTIPAHVISIVPTADRQKATVKVRIGFEELDPRILPDMGVQVRFLDETPAAVSTDPRLVVPESALHADGDRDYVYVLHDDTLERRAVRTGGRDRGDVEIVAGLNAGERVVIEASDALSDGQTVEVN